MTTNVIVQERGPNILVRALYFVLLGIWLSGMWAAVAWFLCVTIIGLSFGLWMLNRLPQVTTLQPNRSDLLITNTGQVMQRSVAQYPFVLRAIYFLFVGWWLSALWLTVAWLLCTIIIGLPVGFWMFNRVPAVVSLAR